MKSVISTSLLLYFFLSLPLVIVFCLSNYLRFIYFEIVARQFSQITPLEYVFVGDSITKGGKNWGWNLEKNPISSKNLAVNGYTTRQVATQMQEAFIYNPRYIFILAGTNDSRLKNLTVEQTINEYHDLLDKFIGQSSIPVITLVPLQSQQYSEVNYKIHQINRELKTVAQQRQIATIDINPTIAPHGYLLAQYTNDGVHFTEAAYQVWRDYINRFLSQ